MFSSLGKFGQIYGVHLTRIGFVIWAMLGQRCSINLTGIDFAIWARFNGPVIEDNSQVGVISAGDILKFYCQMYNVNMTG